MSDETSDPLFSVCHKRVIVTGGSRGIGKMIAQAFVRRGAEVIICARKENELEGALAELAKEGSCSGVCADLSNFAGVDAFAKWVGEKGAKLDVLINNAGAAWGEPLDSYPESGFDRCWGVNVKGLFRLTQKLLPLLRATGTADAPARVINIGSIDGMRVADTENYAYSATKAAVHQLTRQLAHRLVSEHINVNAIAPGLFPSRMTAFLFQDEEMEKSVAATIPMGRFGKPDDIGGAAIYLASAAKSFLTGVVLPVDGGATTHG